LTLSKRSPIPPEEGKNFFLIGVKAYQGLVLTRGGGKPYMEKKEKSTLISLTGEKKKGHLQPGPVAPALSKAPLAT